MILQDLVDLLQGLAAIGGEIEGLSELDHGLQCAHRLALEHPGDEELQAAGLVHDIGHRFGSYAEHGRLGAQYLGGLLGSRVAKLVEAHVPAKRFLVTTEPKYDLSAESTLTLALQGGVMSPDEVNTFCALPEAGSAVRLRRADDISKVPGNPVPPIERWIPVLERLAT